MKRSLFLRAYPQSPRVMRLADEILFSFAQRLPATVRLLTIPISRVLQARRLHQFQL